MAKMPTKSANLFGEYYVPGPRKAVGVWAQFREMLGWRLRFTDDAFEYRENIVTGARKARFKSGIIPNKAIPNNEWLDAVR